MSIYLPSLLILCCAYSAKASAIGNIVATRGEDILKDWSDDGGSPEIFEDELQLDECTVGSWQPVDMRLFDGEFQRFQCEKVCSIGCNVGYAFHLPRDHVICYLAKLEANFRVNLDEERISDRCSCGVYIDNEFHNCARANREYVDKPFMYLSNLRHRCKNHCSEVDVFVTRKTGMPRIVWCMPIQRAEQLWNATFEPHGQCIRANDTLKCVCGISKRTERTYRTNKYDPTSLFRETNIQKQIYEKIIGPENEILNKLKEFKIKEPYLDHRRHDILLHIFTPTFKPPDLEAKLHHNRNILRKYKKRVKIEAELERRLRIKPSP